jgi:hypothetical protein
MHQMVFTKPYDLEAFQPTDYVLAQSTSPLSEKIEPMT